MSRVILHGETPVYVVVDLDRREVVKAVVSDEEFDLLKNVEGFHIGYDENGDPHPTAELVELAAELVGDPLTPWPAWNFGW